MKSFGAGNPVNLFEGVHYNGGNFRTHDVSRDRQRFLMSKDSQLSNPLATPASMVVVVNWLEELKRLVPTKWPGAASAWIL